MLINKRSNYESIKLTLSTKPSLINLLHVADFMNKILIHKPNLKTEKFVRRYLEQI